MATVLGQNQDKEKDQEGQKGLVTSSGQSSSIQGGGSPQAAATPGQRQASSSGRFTNIQNFIKANQGNTLGQQVSGKVEEASSGAQQKLGQAKSDLQGQLGQTAQAVTQSKDAVNQAISNLKGANNDYNVDQGVADESIKNIKSGLDLQYAGPQALGKQQELASEAQNLQGIGKASQTLGGRAALLQRFFGREQPTYNQGQVSLDNLLLGAQNKGLSQVRQASRKFGSDLNQAQEGARTDIAKTQADVEAAKQFARQSAVDTASGSLADLRSETLARQLADKQARDTFTGVQNQALTPNQIKTQALVLNAPKDVVYNGAGFANQLTPEEQRNLGISQFKSDLDLDKTYTENELNSIAGRANLSQSNQLNQLRTLLGQEQIATGPAFQAGQYDVNQGRLQEIQNQYQTALENVLRVNNPNLPSKYRDFNFRSIQGNTPDYVNNLKKQASQEALNKVLSQYSTTGFGRVGSRAI